jgi:hypothetical protein
MSSLHAALIDLWENEPALVALMPAEQVYTGRIPVGVAMPCASMDQPSMSGRMRSNDADYADVSLRLSVWSETYAAGQAIADAIERALSNRTLDYDDCRVLDFRHESTSSEREEEPEDRAWRFVIQFSALRIRARTH